MKKYVANINDKDLDVLSEDGQTLTKQQTMICLDVATMLLGKDEFTEREITPHLDQALVWFVLEKLRRLQLIRIDDRGVPHRTRFGQKVYKYIEEKKVIR